MPIFQKGMSKKTLVRSFVGESACAVTCGVMVK
jgi:hypothetical protein